MEWEEEPPPPTKVDPKERIFLTGGADMTAWMRSPCNAIDTGPVVVQSGNWGAGNSYIKYYHLQEKGYFWKQNGQMER